MLKQANSSGIKIDWLPSYSDLKRALGMYGYLLDSPSKLSSDIDMIHAGKHLMFKPHNNGAFIVIK